MKGIKYFFNHLLSIFQPSKKRPNAPVRVISMWKCNSWGNSIFFINWDKRKVSGHLNPPPKKGDILRSKMESGKIAKFKFEKVEVMSDPSDQFFAVVSDFEYEE